jgi:hypothetical protein
MLLDKGLRYLDQQVKEVGAHLQGRKLRLQAV